MIRMGRQELENDDVEKDGTQNRRMIRMGRQEL